MMGDVFVGVVGYWMGGFYYFDVIVLCVVVVRCYY